MIKENLIAIKRLIAPRHNWTTGRFAKDRSGKSVSPVDATAVCWCLTGAMMKEVLCFDDKIAICEILQNIMLEKSNPSSLSYFNDIQGHVAVLDLLDEAIGRAA